MIHTTIGGGLDEMTSPDDFKLISWKNFLGLSAVVVGVLIPVGLRYILNRRVGGAIALDEDLDEEEGEGIYQDGEDTVLAHGPAALKKGKATTQLILLSDSDEDEEEEDGLEGSSEEDEILEAGPAIVIKVDENLSLSKATINQQNGWSST